MPLMILAYLKPEHWVHHFLEVLEQILYALHLPQEDVELEPHRDLYGDGDTLTACIDSLY